MVSTDKSFFGPGRTRAFSPFLAPDERRKLHDVLNIGSGMPPSFVDELRALARKFIDDGDSLKLRTVCLLVADLCEQGWQVAVEQERITFQPPGIARAGEQTIDDVKARVRTTLQSARLRQLKEPSVTQFLARMERRTLRGGRRTSVLDLIDDGRSLAEELTLINKLPDHEREVVLSRLVDPVVEVCESGAKCSDTGLTLIDIWRYFRHTWAHEYRPIPGRQMLVLIRNAARPNRPVMGIAMLSSPVMRLAARDRWIGWLRESAEERFRRGDWQADTFAASLVQRLEDSIQAIRWDDLATSEEIANPTDTVAMRLEQRAAGAAYARELQLKEHYEQHRSDNGKVRPHRGQVKSKVADVDWMAASEDLLFVRKRAESLSQLLSAKAVFARAGLLIRPQEALDELFGSRDGQKALDTALTELRKAGLSSEIADVSICGAIHPYNELLGGKLVALLLTSKEVRDAYTVRYGNQTSVIASQMAGRAVSKPATLRVLTTTSLYGVGSSQYNRLSLRARENDLDYDVVWSAIGKSLTGGFGTLHLGGETTQALRSMAITRHDSRRVNNRFGEGTSPRLRQIREGLDALGLKSDAILHHATPRLFYACELVPGARDALMGLAKPTFDAPTAAELAQAWRRRWLSNRTRREETLQALSRLGPTSVRASLHADHSGQFWLPIDNF
ncbi:DUF4338 domain-containing protein [Rhizobium leguminosarum bv. viciae]|nr:DUF4338 domain-containing protein [Rhizobium leguminosarum]NKK49342.1 DUF4338 domain-containing protein [Rhizobium leguminosarum bv. viciae]TBY90882.1 DUF4338 domain-containing protein [Rhizobium leguminosarum bv. viciae]